MKKRSEVDTIWFICDVFHPETTSTSQLLTLLFSNGKFCETPIVVLTNKTVARGQDADAIHVAVRRLGLAGLQTKNILGRLARNAAFLVHLLGFLAVNRQGNIIAVTNPPMLPVWIWTITRFTRHKYRLFLQDIYPDGLVATNVIKKKSLVNWIWRIANGLAFRCSNHISVLGRDMKQLICRDYKVDPESVSVLPHWSPYQPSETLPPERSPLVKQLGLTGRFIVHYSGNMGLWHDINALVHAAALCVDLPITFLFIGDGRRRQAAQELASRLQLTNTIWMNFLPLDELQSSLASASVCCISQRAGLEGVAVPCKLYGILAAARPVLAAVPEKSEVAQAVLEDESGVVVEPHSAEQIAGKIRWMYYHPEQLAAMGNNALRAYQQKYTADVAADRFLELLCR